MIQRRDCSCHHPIGWGGGPYKDCQSLHPDPKVVIRKIRAIYYRVGEHMLAVGSWHHVGRY